MAFTSTDADRLREAIASGVLEVEYSDGRRVRYSSTQDLIEALRLVEADLARASDAPRTYGVYSRKAM